MKLLMLCQQTFQTLIQSVITLNTCSSFHNKYILNFIIPNHYYQMDAFKDILMRKAKIIGELKYPQRNNRKAILKHLKTIRKEEKQSEQQDIQVLSSLHQIKYQQKSDLEKVYFLSFTVMKALCKKFQFIPEDNQTFANIVQMHYKFHIKEGALEKAQEIRMAFRNKTLEKDVLLTTLLTWLYEWGKRKLDKFLSKNIASIQKDLLTDKLQSPKKAAQSLQKVQQTSPIKDLTFEGTFMNISYTQKRLRSGKKQDFKIVINGNNDLFLQEQENIDIDEFLSNEKTQAAEQIFIDLGSPRIQTSFEPQIVNELTPGNLFLKQRSKSYNCEYPAKPAAPLQHLNKQIFYGTYWKQINQLYKNFSCIEDLDFYYLKTFKKQKEQRKQEITKNRMDEIVEFMLKNMPKVKKSVQAYDNQYAKFCPNNIKEFHSETSKVLQQENKKKISKNLSFKKPQKRQTQSQKKYYEKMKSEQNALLNESPQKVTKKTAIHRVRQRNKSLNDSISRKSTQQKVQMQVKLPIVYNPEHLYSVAEADAEKALAIHQKFEKFMVNGARPNKGLARYKYLNKQRQKNLHQSYDLQSDKLNLYDSSSIDNRKQQEYEVANIRKILRKREKERLFVNKTPTYQNNKEEQMMDKIMIHIKAMQNQFENEFISPKKVDKFDIFLNNLKNTSSSPFGFKSNSKSTNFGSMKSNQLDYRSQFKSFKDDFLPKIA